MTSLRFSALIIFLFGLLSFGGVPLVTRRIQSDFVAPLSTLRITLDVSFSSGEASSTTAWILQESWPQGCEISSATWNGVAFEPVRRESDCSWLFGYPDTEWGVQDGTLVYLLQVPSESTGNSLDSLQAHGKCFTWDEECDIGGESEILVSEDAPYLNAGAFQLTIQPGWNLLSLPVETNDEERREIFQGGNIYRCSVGVPSSMETMAYCQEILPETSGEPFWMHSPGDVPRVVYLHASDCMEEELVPCGGVWRDGWNLVGVRGGSSLSADSAHGIWLWQDGEYRQGQESLLRPCQAAWVFH